MRVGFVLRSTEIKLLFRDLFELFILYMNIFLNTHTPRFVHLVDVFFIEGSIPSQNCLGHI